jgi:hypothetical protein
VRRKAPIALNAGAQLLAAGKRRQFIEESTQGAQDRRTFQSRDPERDLGDELLEFAKEELEKLVVRAKDWQLGEAEHGADHQGGGVAVCGRAKAAQEVKGQATAAALEVLVGPQRHLHAAGHLAGPQTAAAADVTQALAKSTPYGPLVGERRGHERPALTTYASSSVD